MLNIAISNVTLLKPLPQHPEILCRHQIIRNGHVRADERARRLCLAALETALAAADPSESLSSWLRLKQGRLLAGQLCISLPRSVKVIAIGKASVLMMRTAKRILRGLNFSGILVAPKGEGISTLGRQVRVFHSAHPVPDHEGLRASKQVLSIIRQMDSDELLVCLISGGASAMLPYPEKGVSLQDKKKLTQQLIKSRATIHEINTVRRHVSRLKGGKLVKQSKAGRVLSFIVSDVAGNVLSDIGSGLTAADPTSFSDAINVLKKLNLWNECPSNVRLHLQKGLEGQVSETPKPGDQIFRKVHNFVIADNHKACYAARAVLRKRGIRATILTSSLDMEARSLGNLLASIARDSEAFGYPISHLEALILGGETTVEVKGTGIGGRGQETVLSAVDKIAGVKGVALAAMGTDGIDGNSPAAGAITDGQAANRARRLGLVVQEFADKNDSYSFFRKLRDTIVTSRTGTNVGDLYLEVRV